MIIATTLFYYAAAAAAAATAAAASNDTAAAPPGCAVFEKGWDLMGGDYSVSPAGDKDCIADGNCPCQQRCDADVKCHSWTVVPGDKCCLKGNVPTPSGGGKALNRFSGVKAQYMPGCPAPAPPPPPPPPPLPPNWHHSGPLTCQDNNYFPMLPTFHIIGNVTQDAKSGSINLEPINDASGVTYYNGLYHVWHQCCQNHWDHAISKDLIHWQRLPPPIQPITERTYDGSISILGMDDGGPIFLYDAPDKIPHGWPGCGECILSIARLNNTNDKYLKTFTRDNGGGNPVKLNQPPGKKPVDFPSTIWKNGDHYNFVAQGGRFTTKDKSFREWTRVEASNGADFVGCGENGGQWWIPTPNQVGGAPPPAGTPNQLVNCGGGNTYRIGDYYPGNETFVWDGKSVAQLEHGQAGWWGAQGGAANNDRMMMIGWVSDYHGPAGPGINFLTRLTILREVNWDVKTQNLVANPVPELVGLRTGLMASENVTAFPANAALHVVAKTGDGAAASSDIVITFNISALASAPGTVGTAGTATDTATFGACVLGNGAVNSGIGIKVTVKPDPSPTAAKGARVAFVSSGACNTDGEAGGAPVQLFDETELTVRVLADRSVADWFVQGGRWAATNGWQVVAPRAPADSNVAVWSSVPGNVVTAQVDVYSMGCGWLNPSYTENPTL